MPRLCGAYHTRIFVKPSSSGFPARQGRRLMRRTSRGGWRLSRLAAKRQKSWVGHPEFEPQNRKPGKSAPVTPCEYRAEHGAPMCRILRRTRPSSHFTSGGVPAEVRCFANNSRSALFACTERRACLQINNTKPPPAGFGGAVRRSRAITKKAYLLCVFSRAAKIPK